VYYNDKLKKLVVRKPCGMDAGMRNAQKDPENKYIGMRPLCRCMYKG
jgi:hypothetical protein